MRFHLALCLGFLIAAPALAYINAGFSNAQDAKRYYELLRTNPKAAEEFFNLVSPEKKDYRTQKSIEARKAEEKERQRFEADRLEREIVEPFTAAILKNPQDARTHYRRARAIHDALTSKFTNVPAALRSDWQHRARIDLDRAIQLDPRLAIAFVRRGTLDSTQPEFGFLAFRDFQEAVRLEPRSVLTQSCAALAHLENKDFGDPRQAVRHAEIVCELTQSSPAALELLALACFVNKDREAAIKHQRAAFKAIPQNDPASEPAQLRLQGYQQDAMIGGLTYQRLLDAYEVRGEPLKEAPKK